MRLLHLTASRFFGGPERQMLELSKALRPDVETTFVLFLESSLYRSFLDVIVGEGIQAIVLQNDTPRLWAAMKELECVVRGCRPDVLLCHDYKSNLLGLVVGRRLAVPVVSVAHGWTGECAKVRLYEAIDRRVLRWMDHIVCVSEAQAEKVRRAGVREEKIVVIRNAIREGRFGEANPKYLDRLRGMFATPPDRIVGAAGRLSREKGFQVLVEAASVMLTQHEDASPMGRECAGPNPSVGFVLFGDGRLRGELEREIDARGLHGKFVLGGFSSDLDCYFPHFDLLVLPSFTEGLPNVALEAMAAGVPVVATAVGGTPEVVAHGVTGRLVPPGNPCAMARGMAEVLFCDATATMGLRGKERVREHFSFASQAAAYRRLFGRLLGSSNETSDADGQR